jgi:nicotinamide-nucleotide amidase
MQAELVMIGTELLLGQIIDTNAAYLAQQLKNLGLNLYYKTTVGDNKDRIRTVIEQAHNRAEVVITSGGLGPTLDDLTREAIAEAVGVPLIFRQDLMDQIARRFQKMGATMSPNNARQAYIPEGAIPMENPRGTAPIFAFEDAKGTIIVLPGVPHELKYLMENTIIPYLQKRYGIKALIKYRTLRTTGIGESRVDEAIKDLIEQGRNPTIGLLAHIGGVSIRLTAKGEDEAHLDRLIGEVEVEIRRRLGQYIYGVDEQTLEGVVGELLRAKSHTLALVESLQGGTLIQKLTSVPNAGAFFKEGIVLYSEEAKRRFVQRFLTNIPSLTSSPELAQTMAQGVQQLGGTDIGLCVLGEIISPENPQEEPSAVAYVGLASAQGATLSRTFRVSRVLSYMQERISLFALETLRHYLQGEPIA